MLQNGNVVATTTSGAGGIYTTPQLPPGLYTLQVRADGFLRSTRADAELIANQSATFNLTLSPLLTAGELRIVLTWGAAPNDLDTHMWLPIEQPFQVYYGNRGNLDDFPYANLDTDDTSGFGPETITIRQRINTGQYVYGVYNFSNSPDLTQSQAKVELYNSSGLIHTFTVPTQGTGRYWEVFRLDGATGQVTEINQIVDNPAPY